MSIIQSLKCFIGLHPDGYEDYQEGEIFRTIRCTECDDVLERKKTYYGEARDYILPISCTPIKKGEKIEVGDILYYRVDSAFPGIKYNRSGEVEYLYKTPGIRKGEIYVAKVKYNEDFIFERNWTGVVPQGKVYG